MSLQGIYLASRALQAHQRALELTGQNIANAATPGYSRQVALLRPVDASDAATGAGAPAAVGAGVDASLVLRRHADWLDRSTDALSGQAGDSAVGQRLAAQVEAATGEPGSEGLQATLDQFFSAFQGVADRPDEATTRQSAIQAGVAVAQRFQEALGALGTLRQEAQENVRSGVARVNALTGQIAALNRTIATGRSGGAPVNGLLDQREQLLLEATRLTGATVSGRDEALVVRLGGVTLVQGEQALTLQVGGDGALALSDGSAVPGIGGEIGAGVRWSQETLPDYQARFATLRDTLAAQVNALHAGGRDRRGAAGGAFFVASEGGDLAVHPALQEDTSKLAAGDGSAGDGSVARAIAALRDDPQTLPAYRTLVARIGAHAADETRRDGIAQASLRQVQEMQSAESGVNLDEELAQMVVQQHVYAASARLLATFDQMLETLIQRTGTG